MQVNSVLLQRVSCVCKQITVIRSVIGVTFSVLSLIKGNLKCKVERFPQADVGRFLHTIRGYVRNCIIVSLYWFNKCKIWKDVYLIANNFIFATFTMLNLSINLKIWMYFKFKVYSWYCGRIENFRACDSVCKHL